MTPYQALLAERQDQTWWSTRPDIRADNERRRLGYDTATDELTGRRRLAECLADDEGADGIEGRAS